MNVSPQKGAGSLGAAERCVTCTEAALTVKGIWGCSISQVDLGVYRDCNKSI